MGALTEDRNTPRKEGLSIPVPVAASVKIFTGALLAADADGYATPGATATTLTYLGMAEETVDNTDGADGAKNVLIRRGEAFQFANDGTDPVTQASMGKVCYIVDDQTVAATSGTNTRSAAGTVIGIDADGVWVL
ncbi:MAG: hypothetical protein C4516_04325 [Oxalobacter sp.]|nr:MAG: hypothetical protein C4516_04325 [Oxalobacter sp.]